MDDHESHRIGASFYTDGVRFTSRPSSILFVSYGLLLIRAPIILHEMYYSSISVFINLVILKFPDTSTTPFETHPNTSNAAVICCLLFAYFAKLEAAAGARLAFLRHFVSLFWSLSVASFVSLLLPDGIRPFLYVLSVVPFVVRVMPHVCSVVWRKFRDFRRAVFLRHLWWRLYINQMQNRRRRLPV